MDTCLVLLSVIFGLAAIYWWYIATYFKRMDIPHRVPLPLIGNFLPVILRQKTFIEIFQEYYNRWPNAKYYGIFNFTKPVIVIRDPDLVKTITVKCFDNFMDHQGVFDENVDPLFCRSLIALKGDKWRATKDMLSPAFTASKMKGMFDLISNCAKNFAEIVVININDEGCSIETDMKEVIKRYVNDVIATCAFGIQIDSLQHPDNEFYIYGKKLTRVTYFGIMKSLMLFLFPKTCKFFGITLVDKRTKQFFRNIIDESIRIRQEKEMIRPDLIQILLEAKGKPRDIENTDIDEILAQAFIFFLGAFTSTSTLGSFIAMSLATNFNVQKKLQEEIDLTLKKSNGHPTYETLNDMQYFDAVIYETLRYYPNTLILDRSCNKSFELPAALAGHERVTVTPGVNVWIAVDGIHHDPKYYEEPDKFDPERFVNQNSNINQATFLPFGLGPRSCIGSRFAMMKVKLFFFHLLARCSLKPADETPIPLVLSKTIFEPTFENGFRLNLELRKHSYFGSGL